MIMAIYAETETTTWPTIKLTKVEGVKNSLGVQKLDIRVNDFDGYRIIKNNDFESVYFIGEEILNVQDLTKFKIKTLVNNFKWYTNLVSLAEGQNEITLEIKKNNKIFKMIVTVVVEYPQTTAETTTEATTATNTDTETPTPTPTGTGNITTSPSPNVTTTATATPNDVDVDKLPKTGDTDSSILIVFGIFLIGSSAGFLILMRLKNAKNN
jgi:LPXTG-motif cell wall-anchored protein